MGAPLVVPLALGAPLVFGAMPLVLEAAPLILGTALVDFGAGRREGRGAVPVEVLVVVRERAGRDAAAADGGRDMTGRAEDVPLNDCRDEEREGTDWLDGWRTYGPHVGLAKKASHRCGG